MSLKFTDFQTDQTVIIFPENVVYLKAFRNGTYIYLKDVEEPARVNQNIHDVTSQIEQGKRKALRLANRIS